MKYLRTEYFYKIFIISLLTGFYSCQKEDFTQTGMADDHFFLQSDGQKMPITVKGNLSSNKIIVIVHGGPGGSSISTYRTSYVTEKVEKEFAVVYYDQSFAGSTQGNGGTVSLERIRDDFKKMILLLKLKYGSDKKLYLLAHSWGGFLAPYFLIDGNNQSLVNGWIQVDGAHNYSYNSLQKEMFLEVGNTEIKGKRNTKFWQEIVDYCNSTSYKEVDYDVMMKLNSYSRETDKKIPAIEIQLNIIDHFAKNHNNGSISSLLSNSYYNVFGSNINRLAYAQNPVVGKMGNITIPTLLLWGRYDFVCPPKLKEEIKKEIKSKDISEKIFEKSGHSPMYNEPESFWNEVVAWISTH